MSRPRLLDLFCGAGGAAMGYYRAGFDVVGVDIERQKHYPFDFIHADALTFPLNGFDAIHASPPCQFATRAGSIHGKKHPDLLAPTRQRLRVSGVPWVIENVIGAPMGYFLELCGTQFGLHVYRHRQFESSFMLLSPGKCHHPSKLLPGYYSVFGRIVRDSQMGSYGNKYTRYPAAVGRTAMGIDWPMPHKGLSQAIPPAYTEWIGRQLLAALALDEAM